MSGKSIGESTVTGNTVTGSTMTGNTVTGLAAVLAGNGRLASTMQVLPLALISFYLMFAPVWAPLISSRVYDDARYMQLGLLAVMVVFLVLPSIRDAVLAVWSDLGRRVHSLWVIFLVGGIVSAAFSQAPHLAALELSLVIQLAFLTLLVCALL